MFLPEKASFPGSLQKNIFALPPAPFTMLLYRSREVSSECSGTIEHICQSPVFKGSRAPCCHGHLQSWGVGPGSIASAKFQGRSLPLPTWYKQGCLSRWLHHFGALFPLLRASLQAVNTWSRVFTSHMNFETQWLCSLGQGFQLHSPSVMLTVLKSTCKAFLCDIYFIKLKHREKKKISFFLLFLSLHKQLIVNVKCQWCIRKGSHWKILSWRPESKLLTSPRTALIAHTTAYIGTMYSNA